MKSLIKTITANISKRKVYVGLFLTGLFGLSVPLLASNTDYSAGLLYSHIHEPSKAKISKAKSVDPFQTGDSIGLQNGSLSIEHVDVSLPGNSSLPVEVRRTYSAEGRSRRFQGRDFGDWILNIPRITSSAKMSNGEVMNSWAQGGECSGYGYQTRPTATYKTTDQWPDTERREALDTLSFDDSAYWSADTISIPGVINQKFLVHNSGNGRVLPPGWKVECYTRTTGGFINNQTSGEKFEITSPSGVTYTFAQLRVIQSLLYREVSNPDVFGDWNDWLDHSATLEMLVTKVEDRFGNHVNYNYNTYGELQNISSNDGRLVTFSYSVSTKNRKLSALHVDGSRADLLGTSSPMYTGTIDPSGADYVLHPVRFALIDTVTVNGRVWDYDYQTAPYDEYESLTSVTLPNSESWSFNLALDVFEQPIGNNGDINSYSKSVTCDIRADGITYTDTAYIQGLNDANYFITPYGAKISYHFDARLIGRTAIPNGWNIYEGEIPPGTHNIIYDPIMGDVPEYGWKATPKLANCSLVNAVTRKTVAVSPTERNHWLYDYSQNYGKFSSGLLESAVTTDMQLTGSLPSNINNLDYNWTSVTTPTGSVSKHFFNRQFGNVFEGKEFATQYFDTNGSIKLKELQHTYLVRNDLGDLPLGVGARRSTATTLSDSTVAQENEVFTEYAKTIQTYSGGSDIYTKYYHDFNTYGVPRLLTESNDYSSNIRHTKQLYQHDTLNNVLNLPTYTYLSTDGVNWTNTKRTRYWASTHTYKSLPEYEYSYGLWQKRYSHYHTDGNLLQVVDNIKRYSHATNRRYSQFHNYKRGTPQTIKKLNNDIEGITNAYFVVDDNGWVTESTDFEGNVVEFGYDGIGRLAYQAPADSQWLDTIYSWSTNTSGEPVRSMKRCHMNATKTACGSSHKLTQATTYDQMLRPKLLQTTDVSNNNNIYVNTEYDGIGQLIFSSVPSLSATETNGTSGVYDGLSRQVSMTSPGNIVSTTEYLLGNKIKTIDPRYNEAITTYHAYGAPSYQQANRIDSEEDVTTTMAIDVFGNINSITQSGYHGSTPISQTEYRVYNAQKRLCKTIRDDVGTTVYNRNAIGEVTWEAKGQSLPNLSSCNTTAVSASEKVTYNYDNLGQVKTVSYGDNTPTKTFTYDKNGNVKTITDGAFSQSYVYNSAGLLDLETLTIDSKSFSLDYSYDSMMNLSSLIYPDGSGAVDFAPNAFGQPSKAVRTSNGTQFVQTGASYYPNGMIDSFTFGNGVVHKTTLNSRYIPQIINDYLGSSNKMKLTYSYDDANNITQKIDGVNSSYSLNNLNYDGLDRLTSTTGNSGIGNSSITYDGLGNIRAYSNTSSAKPHNLTYGYNSSFRLTSLTGNGSSGYNFGQASSYDTRGNVINNGKRGFDYNLADQMTASGDYLYSYDGQNRRVKSVDSKGISYSLYSQAGKLMYRETSDGGINYIYFGDKLVAKEGTGVVDSGSSQQHYKPFGSTIEAEKDDVGYTGHKFDSDLGLSYMQARYYDPVIGRFYSNDPLGFRDVHSFNRYGYANNNPFKYVDPDGKDSFDIYDGKRRLGKAALPKPRSLGEQAEGAATAAGIITAVVTGGATEIVAEVTGLPITPRKAVQQITKSSKKRIKKLVRTLSDNSRMNDGLSPKKTEQLERIVEKAGAKLRNDGTSGVKGTSAGKSHVQTEGLGSRTDKRHIWTKEQGKE